MILTVKDRLIIPLIMAPEDGLLAKILARDIRKKIELSQEDFKTIEFKAEVSTGRSVWNDEKEKAMPPFDISFTDAELKYLRDQVDRLDKERKINDDFLDTVLKITGKG